MKLFDCKFTRLWENPQIPALNRLRSHATFFPYNTEVEARNGSWEPESCPNIQLLNGNWQFFYATCPEAVQEEFWSPEFDDSAWDQIAVPGNWTCQGYDHPHYTNVKMPWPDQPPRVPEANPTGVYRRTFELDSTQVKRRVVLHFGGVESCFFVVVNGVEVGMAKDSRTDSEFELTGFVHAGSNQLTVVVIRYSDGSFLEDQDHWWMAGIYRDVYLYTTPRCYIADVFAKVSLQNSYQDGQIELQVNAGFMSHIHPEGITAKVRLYDPNSRAVFSEAVEIPVATNNGVPHGYRKITVKNPLKWSAETPHLYLMTVELCNAQNEVEEATRIRLGFRSIELKNGNLLVNGEAVKFWGINRHDHDPLTGKTVTVELMRKDIELMKQFNFNALRTCHYPNDPRLLDLCDEYGMYVIDEANIECHAYYHTLTDDPVWLPAMIDRVSRMVIRDQNHACITTWSMGNESGIGANFGGVVGWVRRYDSSRRVMYEGALHPHIHEQSEHWWDQWSFKTMNPDLTDVIPPMYSPLEHIREYLKHDDPRPLIFCEYQHAMGNSNGSMKDYFQLFRREKRLQGGYIWDWVDQGLEKVDATGRKYWAYGGDFGDQPTDYSFCINGLVWPDRKPHPAMYEFKYLAQPFAIESVSLPAGEFRLINYNYFKNLADLQFYYKLLVDGVVVGQREINLPDVAPQNSEIFKLDWQLPQLAEHQELSIVFYAKLKQNTVFATAGHEVGHQQFTLTSYAPIGSRAPRKKLPLEVKSRVWSIGLSQISFDESGTLSSWIYAGTELCAQKPQINLLRGCTENDVIRCNLRTDERKVGYKWLETYGLDNLQPQISQVKFSPVQEEAIQAASAVDYRMKNQAVLHVERQFTLHPNGALAVSLSYDVPPELADLPRLGWSFILPPGFENFQFFGNGPLENYCDRAAGAILAYYKQTVSGQYVPYIVPQECGNHTQVRWCAVDNGKLGLGVIARRPVECSALHFAPQDFLAATHTCELIARPETWLNLDLAQRGLGTASCGPDTLAQYRIPAGKQVLNFLLVPYEVGRTDPDELYLNFGE